MTVTDDRSAFYQNTKVAGFDDVPYEESAAMDKELTRHKVPHELITVRGAGHGLSGGDKKAVADAHAKALAFIRAHLKNGK